MITFEATSIFEPAGAIANIDLSPKSNHHIKLNLYKSLTVSSNFLATQLFLTALKLKKSNSRRLKVEKEIFKHRKVQ